MYIRRLFEQIYGQFMLYSLVLCFAFPMKIDYLLSLFLNNHHLTYVQCFLFDVSIDTIEPTSPGFHPTLSGSTRVSDQGGHDLSGGPHP